MKTAGKKVDNIFLVETVDSEWFKKYYLNSKMEYKECYRTKDDIAGNGVKGFIEIQDASPVNLPG